MKIHITSLILCIAIQAPSIAQQSDHSVIESYREAKKELNNELYAASSVDQYQQITDKIDSLQQVIHNNLQLFDYAFYPADPADDLEHLRRLTQRHTEFYMVTEHTTEQLNRLKKELQFAEDELAVLTRNSKAQRDKLDGLVQQNRELDRQLNQYRSMLSERDILVFTLVDSLLLYTDGLLRFDKGGAGMEGSDSPVELSKDPLHLISNTLENQIESLSAESKYLDATDLLRSYNGYHHIYERWQRLQPAFHQYADAGKSIRIIDDQLKELRVQSGTHFWTRVRGQLTERGFDVDILDNRDTFMNWVNTQIHAWENDSDLAFSTSEDTRSLIAFHGYWQQHFEGYWRSDLVSSRLMSEADLMMISETVDRMLVESKPLPTWVLLLGVLCTMSLLAFVFVMYRSNNI